MFGVGSWFWCWKDVPGGGIDDETDKVCAMHFCVPLRIYIQAVVGAPVVWVGFVCPRVAVVALTCLRGLPS